MGKEETKDLHFVVPKSVYHKLNSIAKNKNLSKTKVVTNLILEKFEEELSYKK